MKDNYLKVFLAIHALKCYQDEASVKNIGKQIMNFFGVRLSESAIRRSIEKLIFNNMVLRDSGINKPFTYRVRLMNKELADALWRFYYSSRNSKP